MVKTNSSITPLPSNNELTWTDFAQQVRAKKPQLLVRLNEFPSSILVTGCQRSGTTILARVLTNSAEMTNYWFGRDDELDAALILSGHAPHQPSGRYCFQTTYLNENYPEYFSLREDHKMIWVLRNPYSVIYSMLYNWKPYSFQELFDVIGKPMMSTVESLKFKLLRNRAIPPIQQAALSFNGKTDQLFHLHQKLPTSQLMIVDYDDLVGNKDKLLPSIYDFVGLPYHIEYADKIHGKSVSKKKELSAEEQNIVETISMPVYERARQLMNREGI